MLVETDSEAETDSNSELCLLEVDSDVLVETDSELKTDSDALAETDAEFKTDSERLTEAETETLAVFEANSDTDAD